MQLNASSDFFQSGMHESLVEKMALSVKLRRNHVVHTLLYMAMNVYKSLLLLLLLPIFAFSCSKIELDDGDETETPVVPVAPSGGGQGESSGSEKGNGESTSEPSGYTVGQLVSLSSGQEVTVVGYIVGYASGKTFYVGLPGDGGVSSNIVIADSPSEPTSFAACQLVSGSKPREQLNLVDNPQMLKRKVQLTGRVMKYFGYMGLKPLRSFVLLQDGSQSGTQPSEGGGNTPSKDDETDKPSQGGGGTVTPPSSGDADKPSGGGQTDIPSGGGEQGKPSGGGSTDNPSKDPDIGEGEY